MDVLAARTQGEMEEKLVFAKEKLGSHVFEMISNKDGRYLVYKHQLVEFSEYLEECGVFESADLFELEPEKVDLICAYLKETASKPFKRLFV